MQSRGELEANYQDLKKKDDMLRRDSSKLLEEKVCSDIHNCMYFL